VVFIKPVKELGHCLGTMAGGRKKGGGKNDVGVGGNKGKRSTSANGEVGVERHSCPNMAWKGGKWGEKKDVLRRSGPEAKRNLSYGR